jgi:hypothetical protein
MGLFTQNSGIKRESIRAKIIFNGYTWKTPDVKSFSINMSRESLSNTFSASLSVTQSDTSAIQNAFSSISEEEGKIVIQVAYTEGDTIPTAYVTLFTGYVRQSSVRRSFVTPGNFIVDLSGNDALYKLENRTYSRRVYDDKLGVFALITGVVRKGHGSRHTTTSEVKFRTSGRGRSDTGDTSGHSGEPRIPEHVTKPHRANRAPDFARPGSSGGVGTSTTTTDELVIVPSILVMAPGQSATFVCASGCTAGGDDAYTWTVDTPIAGGIMEGSEVRQSLNQANPAGGVVYKQLAFLNNVLRLTKNSTSSKGKALILTMAIHDHSSIGQGGPAFGVYATIEE